MAVIVHYASYLLDFCPQEVNDVGSRCFLRSPDAKTLAEVLAHRFGFKRSAHILVYLGYGVSKCAIIFSLVVAEATESEAKFCTR